MDSVHQPHLSFAMKYLVRIHWASAALSVLLSLYLIHPWGYALSIVSFATFGLALARPNYIKYRRSFILPRVFWVGRFVDVAAFILLMSSTYFYALLQPTEERQMFLVWTGMGAVLTPPIFFFLGLLWKQLYPVKK